MAATARPRSQLVDLLQRSLGVEAAEKHVADACKALDISGDTLALDQALKVLEHMAQVPGIVGVTARFAKARVHLAWEAAT